MHQAEVHPFSSCHLTRAPPPYPQPNPTPIPHPLLTTTYAHPQTQIIGHIHHHDATAAFDAPTGIPMVALGL